MPRAKENIVHKRKPGAQYGKDSLVLGQMLFKSLNGDHMYGNTFLHEKENHSYILEAKPAFSYNAFLKRQTERTVVKNEFSVPPKRRPALKETIPGEDVRVS